MTAGIRLIALEGGLLGRIAGQALDAAITAAAPLDAVTVTDILRRRLYPNARTTPELIQQLAAELSLQPRKLRCLLHTPRPLLLAPTARALLAGLRDACPDTNVVVCSNIAAADADHADLIRAELGPLLDATHFSHRTGIPTGTGPEELEHLARHHHVDVSEITYVTGDRHDLHTALLAGCRALWVHSDHTSTPRVATSDRYRTATDLAGAITELRQWIPDSVPRPTLPVHAAGVIRNSSGQLLLVRRASDEKFSFPGGRCASHGADSPPQARIREVHEELRLTVTAETLLWTGWSEGESSLGENKTHFVFEAHLVGTTVPDPDHAKVAEYQWASNSEALNLLHTDEANRLVRIIRGQRHGWQHGVRPAP